MINRYNDHNLRKIEEDDDEKDEEEDSFEFLKMNIILSIRKFFPTNGYNTGKKVHQNMSNLVTLHLAINITVQI